MVLLGNIMTKNFFFMDDSLRAVIKSIFCSRPVLFSSTSANLFHWSVYSCVCCLHNRCYAGKPVKPSAACRDAKLNSSSKVIINSYTAVFIDPWRAVVFYFRSTQRKVRVTDTQQLEACRNINSLIETSHTSWIWVLQLQTCSLTTSLCSFAIFLLCLCVHLKGYNFISLQSSLRFSCIIHTIPWISSVLCIGWNLNPLCVSAAQAISAHKGQRLMR